MKKTFALAGMLLCAACGGEPVIGTPNEPVDTTDLCISTACGELFGIATIPDAENLLITPEGRVFVSGGENVYEILLEGSAFTADKLYVGSCNFTGLARIKNTLYAACADGGLFAASLSASPLELARIHELSGMGLPNGMTDGPDHCLYITDGPLSTTALPSPQIVRACPDAAAPQVIATQEVWMNLLPDAPNGITRVGYDFYITDTTALGAQGRVRHIPMDMDFLPEGIETIYTTNSILDDLSAYGESLLLTDYLSGTLLQINRRGEIIQEGVLGTHTSPSSITVAGPPVFQAGDVLVTEKGVLGDTTTDFGNRLTLIRRAIP